jgi:tetratricopeptide (TPR) repeat protein
MLRVLFAAACVVLFAAPLYAGGADHLKAANDAAANGKVDDAIGLYTQALTAGDLSPADQLAAHKGRGGAYSSKSAIADTFQRTDEARKQRADAIADFTAAIALKSDDESLYVARGQTYHMDGQYDQATADFDAALKLKNSPVTLIQRGSSNAAKGDYDGAVADYTTALTLDGKAEGLDGWEIYNERGYAEFLATHFDNAAADFAKALELGMPSRAQDVLWLPYQAAWLHIARARGGHDDTAELTANAAKMNLKQWPGTLTAYFLGQAQLADLSAASSHGMMAHARECNLSFFTGEQALAKGDIAGARGLFLHAHDMCNIHTLHYLASSVETKRLTK